MSDPITPGHPFVRPGQVSPDLPPPDSCVRCGAPWHVHTAAAYADAANELDQHLDERLREIRNRTDLGQLTITEAAALRVAALEQHISEIQRLRAEHFG